MKHLLLLITLFTFSSLQAQNFTVETRIDEWDENKVNLSFEFSKAVEPIGNLEDELPLPFLITSPIDKFTVDSVHINQDMTLFDVFLSVQDNTDYAFVAPIVMSKDQRSLRNELDVNFSTSDSSRYELSGEVFDAYGLTGKYGKDETDEITGIPHNSSILAVLDKDAADSLGKENFDPVNWKSIFNLYSKTAISFEYEYQVPFSLTYAKSDSVILAHVHVGLETSVENELDVSNSVFVSVYKDFSDIHVFSSSDSANIEFNAVYYTSTEQSPKIPQKTTISAYPNPFNPSTQIQYTLPEAGNITISIFNVLGQQVRTLAEGTRSSGAHTITFNATGLPAGMYVVRLESTGQSGKVFAETKKVMLLK